jgi:hypothetical protein
MISDLAWIKFGKSMMLMGGIACVLLFFLGDDEVANFYLRAIVGVYGLASIRLFWINR